MNSWVQGGEQIKSLTGNFADIFIDSFIENIEDRFIGRASEIWNAMTSWITGSNYSIDFLSLFSTSLGMPNFLFKSNKRFFRKNNTMGYWKNLCRRKKLEMKNLLIPVATK